MAILELGTILSWENSKKARLYVKQKGIEQFILLFNLHKNRLDSSEHLKWGEEIEFNMVEFDDFEHSVKPYTKCADVHHHLDDLESTVSNFNNTVRHGGWHFEYGSFMIESIPGSPYNLSLNAIPSIQKSLSYRRWKLGTVLPSNVSGTTISALPNLGSVHYLKQGDDPTILSNRVSRSVFLDDNIITDHARFNYLTKNIYKRRGAKVSILVPLKIDDLTYSNINWSNSVEKDSINRYDLQYLSESNPNPIKDHIYMDTMGFGMGMSCVQATYMLPDIDTARYIYDQFTVLSPLWLAMTASTPFFRGMVASSDARWAALSQSVDCRTEEEMTYISKSRYASVSLYISKEPPLADHLDELNDLNLTVNEEAFSKLIESGVDHILAKHIAYLFIRDPMVIFQESLKEGTSFYYTHFDNIQSTNWNSVRFKPPPSFDNSHSKIGWRVEFRTPELQMTDFENSAFIAFLTVLVQILIKDRLELYIPISKCDENFEISHRENAIVNQKFWFRNNINAGSTDRSYKKKSLEEILISRDKDGHGIGLISRCEDYVNSQFQIGKCSQEARDILFKYFNFISLRIQGTIDTNATFFRKLLKAHPDYKHDSIIPPSAAYDICQLANKVGSLSMQVPELFGPFTSNFNAGFENNSSESSLQRYLYSQRNTDIFNEHKSEPNLSRIMSFSTTSASNENLLTFFDDSPKSNLALIPKLQDFVISEDFTKSWMLRCWLSDPNSCCESDLDHQTQGTKPTDLMNDFEYITRVIELSA